MQAMIYAGGATLLLALVLAGSWTLLHLQFARPLAALGREARTVAHSNVERGIEIESGHLLGELPAAVADLVAALAAARTDVVKAMAGAAARMEEQKSRLEAILIDLDEGVVVCNTKHRILLYNTAAVQTLEAADALGLGRSLFDLMTAEPVLHTFERLEQRRKGNGGEAAAEKSAPFVCAAGHAGTMLHGRMSLILDANRTVTGYVITFADISKEVVDLAKRDVLLREATEGMRTPFANLRAAAETLASYPDIAADKRAAFERVIHEQIAVVSERIDRLAGEYRTIAVRQWPMADVYSADLLNCVGRHLKDKDGIEVTLTGMPLWVHGDSHALMLALEHLIRCLRRHAGHGTFDVETLLGDRRVYIDIVWAGAPARSMTLDGWLDAPLAEAPGGATVREVLERHGSEPWSQQRRPGQALLRLPLMAPVRPQFQAPKELPPRPEFYDFDLIDRHPVPSDLAERALEQLSYVVFDTETTGLKPSAGDEIVSIAGVRIVNGRILTGETFQRLVNPGRTIPRYSTNFHGITDDMVRDKPPIQVVLPQFKSFCGDSVLVAHNAAFDMKFIRLKEAASGVAFDNPVLDSLLLSAVLHEDATDHSLDSIAARFGIDVAGRHTALGDSMVTAAIFVRMLELLTARGIATLAQSLAATERCVEIRKQQAQF
jgi:DNA polymerase-3 subunit epsilon